LFWNIAFHILIIVYEKLQYPKNGGVRKANRLRILTVIGCLLSCGFSKQPALSPQNESAIAGHLRSMCLANPQGVSQINKVGGYFNDKNKSAASRTDSWSSKNLEATVHYKSSQKRNINSPCPCVWNLNWKRSWSFVKLIEHGDDDATCTPRIMCTCIIMITQS
jgi:hypothetical protein